MHAQPLKGRINYSISINNSSIRDHTNFNFFNQDLALFFCAYLKDHGSLIEKQQLNEPLLKSLHYLLMISEVEDVEIFKICLEYWNSLCADLYRESPFSSCASPLFMSRPTNSTPQRRQASSICAHLIK